MQLIPVHSHFHLRAKLALVLSVCALLATSTSLAASTDEKAAAEALFQEAVRLMKAGEFEAACSKLEASQRLDEAVGTLLRLGHCYEQTGRVASAWATFREAASLAELHGQDRRHVMARARADALESRLSTLKIVLDDSKADATVSITRNGLAVPRASWGLALPVDPGQHRIDASAAGHRSWRTLVTVGDRGKATVRVPPLAAMSPNATAERAPTSASSLSQSNRMRSSAEKGTSRSMSSAKPATVATVLPSDETTADRAQARSWQRSSGLVIAGVGAAGVVTGAVLGVAAHQRNQESLDRCRPEESNTCTPDGKRLRDESLDLAGASTIAFIAGGALLTGGVVLYVTAPSANRTVTRLELVRFEQTGAAATLRGAF